MLWLPWLPSPPLLDPLLLWSNCSGLTLKVEVGGEAGNSAAGLGWLPVSCCCCCCCWCVGGRGIENVEKQGLVG
jgi:hypothetical protein